MNVRTSVSSDVARPPAARVLAAALLIGLLVVTGCGGRPGAGGDAHEAPAAGGHADGPAGEHTDEHGHDEHGAEGVVELTAAAARNAHLRVAAAGPATIATLVEAPGEIHLNAERVLEIRPRFPGVVRELRKRVGDAVRAGEVVAVVQSNESLTDYEVISSMTGTVLARPAVTGSAVSHESSLMTLADLSTVWADFAIYPQWVAASAPVSRRRSSRRTVRICRRAGPSATSGRCSNRTRASPAPAWCSTTRTARGRPDCS